MEKIKHIIDNLPQIEGAELKISTNENQLFATVDPEELSVELERGASAKIVVLHEGTKTSNMTVKVGEDAHLELAELYLSEVGAKVNIEQADSSVCHVSMIALGGAKTDYVMDLNGRGAESSLHGLFLLGGKEQFEMTLRTNHNVPDCVSNSSVKGVAGGESVGKFWGLVYVAPDAQRTDAQQQSRNILLSETARIDTKPQLEIYADDVKCTHGATVGQMDDDAILYMRQRGLSESQARSLQVEGFVSDVVLHCGIEPLCEALMARLATKLEK